MQNEYGRIILIKKGCLHMQKLQFEASWDRTIYALDREKIQKTFDETCLPETRATKLTPLWQALNYKHDLLVTVLVHNFSQQPLSFLKRKIAYLENQKVMAEHSFTLPALMIEPETSMPWTFIFPAESVSEQATRKQGFLTLEK
jgi:SLAP domain-containing protein